MRRIEAPKIKGFSLPELQINRLARNLGVELEQPIRVKKDKVFILQNIFRFKEHLGLNDNYPVDIHLESGREIIAAKRKEILETIDRELLGGNFIHIRIIDKNQRGSDNPVSILARNSGRKSGEAYRREEEDDLEGKLALENGELVGFDIEGEVVELVAGMHVDIFSQPVSAKAKISDLDNKIEYQPKRQHQKNKLLQRRSPHLVHQKEMRLPKKESGKTIRLGGGFRMEFEDIENKHNPPLFIFKAVVMFDDNSPRRTALNLKKEQSIPRKEISIALEYDEKEQKFLFPKSQMDENEKSLEEIIKNGKAIDIGMFILKRMVEEDGAAIARWLEASLFIIPEEGVHSIEGVFSIKRNNGGFEHMGPKIISFDGIETEFDWLNLMSKRDGNKHEIVDSPYRRFRKLHLSNEAVKAGFMDRAIENFSPYGDKKPEKEVLDESEIEQRKRLAAIQSEFSKPFDPEALAKKTPTHQESGKVEETPKSKAGGDSKDSELIETIKVQLLKESRMLSEYQNKVAAAVNNLLENAPIIDDEIKEIIKEHIKLWYASTFSNERSGPRLLGGLLKTIYRGNPTEQNKSWELIHQDSKEEDLLEISNVQCNAWHYKMNENDFFLISVDGFTLGFWIQNGVLIKINDIKILKEKSAELSQLLETPIVDAMFGYIREGD